MDDVGDSIKEGNANWIFSGEVCKTFDQHVSKSVPFYNEGHDLIAKISDYFLQNGSLCYLNVYKCKGESQCTISS